MSFALNKLPSTGILFTLLFSFAVLPSFAVLCNWNRERGALPMSHT